MPRKRERHDPQHRVQREGDGERQDGVHRNRFESTAPLAHAGSFRNSAGSLVATTVG